MARLDWTPWRSHEELLTVKEQLFSGRREGEPDQRPKACNTVSVWRSRGHLPHTVDSTAMLIEAVLADERGTLSPIATRLLYVGAFCRFVTGLVDSGPRRPGLRHGSSQGQGHRGFSMYARAKQLKLPASFVGLRHDATHESVPTIHALQQAVPKALNWLWLDYWREQVPKRETSKLSRASAGDIDAIKDGLRDVLTRYHERGIAERGRDAQPKLDDESTKACLELIRLCKGNEEVLGELAVIMTEWGIMVPDSEALGKPIDDEFTLWDPLVVKLCSHQQPFFKALADQMSIQLALPSGPMDISVDRYREVISMWLEHIFATKRYAATIKRAKYDINHILSTCVNCQNYWTVQLARLIMAAPGHESTKKNYQERVANAIPHLAAGPDPSVMYRKVTTTWDAEDPSTGEKVAAEVEHEEEEELEPGGWKPANPKLWKSRPIGGIIY